MLQALRLQWQYGGDPEVINHLVPSFGGVALVTLFVLVFRILLRNHAKGTAGVDEVGIMAAGPCAS
jgi:hypothetical protein